MEAHHGGRIYSEDGSEILEDMIVVQEKINIFEVWSSLEISVYLASWAVLVFFLIFLFKVAK